MKLYNVISDLLYFLVTKKGDLLPEFKATCVYSVKLMLEVNANSLYCENLRILKDHHTLAKLCKTSCDKLREAEARFIEIKDEIRN